MEGKQKVYTIYKIKSPTGHIYIGYTSMTLAERWRHHKIRAFSGEAPNHPFYNEIIEYGADNFSIEPLCVTYNRQEALKLEEQFIAQSPKEITLNLSKGGTNDASEGGRIFWERINKDPKKREEYLKKLSVAIKKSRENWSEESIQNLKKGTAKWRKEHPREAYANIYRAVRVANRKLGYPPPCYVAQDTRPLKERLMHKYKLNELKRQYVTEIWRNRSPEEKAKIFKKISESHILYKSKLSDDERRQMTAKARASIDKEKQGAAASKGLKKWWEELKKDPERYKAYIEARTKTLKEGLSKNANL